MSTRFGRFAKAPVSDGKRVLRLEAAVGQTRAVLRLRRVAPTMAGWPLGGRYGKAKMFKTFAMPLGIAALIAALLTMASDRRGFEELAVRAAIADDARVQGSKCPLS